MTQIHHIFFFFLFYKILHFSSKKLFMVFRIYEVIHTQKITQAVKNSDNYSIQGDTARFRGGEGKRFTWQHYFF